MSDVATIRWSDHGPFSIIPEWLLDADVSDRAIRLYAILGRYADQFGQSMPSRQTLADRLRCVVSTLDVALGELRDAGALSWAPRSRRDGGRTTSDYVLHANPLTAGQVTPLTAGQVTPLTDSPVTPPPEGRGGKRNENQVNEKGNDLTVVPRPVPKLTKIDGRNLGFDTLAKVCSISPQSPRTRQIPAALSQIRSQWWAEVEGGGAFTTAEGLERALATAIESRARMYLEKMPGALLTPTALAKWWTDLLIMPGQGSKGDRVTGGSAMAKAEELARQGR